jgi:hypothetical protein
VVYSLTHLLLFFFNHCFEILDPLTAVPNIIGLSLYQRQGERWILDITTSSYKHSSAPHPARLKCRSSRNDNGRTSKNRFIHYVTPHHIKLTISTACYRHTNYCDTRLPSTSQLVKAVLSLLSTLRPSSGTYMRTLTQINNDDALNSPPSFLSPTLFPSMIYPLLFLSSLPPSFLPTIPSLTSPPFLFSYSFSSSLLPSIKFISHFKSL